MVSAQEQRLQCPAELLLGAFVPKRGCCAALQPSPLHRLDWMRVASSRVGTGCGRASGKPAAAWGSPLT